MVMMVYHVYGVDVGSNSYILVYGYYGCFVLFYVNGIYGHGYDVLIYMCFLFGYVLVYGLVCSFVGL